MPVLPLVGSTMVPPGFSAPLASAASTMRTAMRSFTEPPGLKYSTFASTSGASGPRSRVTEVRRTSGVLPTRSRADSTYCTGGLLAGHRPPVPCVPIPPEAGVGGPRGRRTGERHGPCRPAPGTMTGMDAAEFWDEQAATFDDEPDHGLTAPPIRAAWARLLLPLVPT